MSKEFSYTILQNKRWRAISYDWEILSTYGNQSNLYCLTDFQAAWLLSNTQYMRWGTRWDNCPCTPGDLDKMAAELEYNLMNCLDLQPWQMDYIYDQMQAQNLAGLDSLWDGVNPDSVNPNTPNDFYSGDDSDDRLNALCTACKIYVYSYAENWSNIASSVLQIANLVALATRLLPVGGIIAGVIVKGLAYLTEIALNAMQDESALDDIVCCMYNNLDGTALLSANFETSLDGCSFTVGSNQAIARDIIGSDLDQFGNWLSFINQLGNSYVLAEAGVYDCPCNEPWVWESNFLSSENIWQPQPSAYGNKATWTDTIGYEPVDIQTSGTVYSRLCVIETDEFTPTSITRVRLQYDFQLGTYDVPAQNAIQLVLVRDDDSLVTDQIQANATTNGYGLVFDWDNIDEPSIKQIWVNVRSSSRAAAVYSGIAKPTVVLVEGEGFNPFV